jgi:hypothetical protein
LPSCPWARGIFHTLNIDQALFDPVTLNMSQRVSLTQRSLQLLQGTRKTKKWGRSNKRIARANL